MKIGIYPGSFNPWHEGHADIVTKALKVFDKVLIAQGVNPEKPFGSDNIPSKQTYGRFGNKVIVSKFSGLLSDFIRTTDIEIAAIIRGLRNSSDFEFEKTQQYWNEVLVVDVPTVYFISDRKLTHISSSAIRMVEKLKP